MLPPPPRSTLFPYTTLFRSHREFEFRFRHASWQIEILFEGVLLREVRKRSVDRKSTRLNSSHTVISYAVFCLKKKKKPQTTRLVQTQVQSETATISRHPPTV